MHEIRGTNFWDTLYSLPKQNIKSRNAERLRQRERWKTTIGLISKKATLHVQYTFFLHFFRRCFVRPQRETSRNSPVTRFEEEMSYVFLITFFSLPLIFTLVAASIFHFLTAATKFSCCSSNKKMSSLFISRSSCLSPFFSLSFAGLSPTFPFSLSFCFSIFQICEHDNFTKLTTLDNKDTETISAFRFPLYWVVSASQDASG